PGPGDREGAAHLVAWLGGWPRRRLAGPVRLLVTPNLARSREENRRARRRRGPLGPRPVASRSLGVERDGAGYPGVREGAREPRGQDRRGPCRAGNGHRRRR